MEPEKDATADPHAAGVDASKGKPIDPRAGLRAALFLDVVVRLFIWGVALALSTAVTIRLNLWPSTNVANASLTQLFSWALTACVWVLLFNVFYVLELIVLRLPIPTPKEGRYCMTEGKLDSQVLWSCLLGVLSKARYEAPFPAFLVYQISSLPPLHWLMAGVVGPRSRSCHFVDPRILDPHLVELGRNVVVGLGSTISGHHQECDTVVFGRTVIEDDVLIGAHAAVAGGVRIGAGAVIIPGSYVKPGTVIGPNEMWCGIPARRLKKMSLAATEEPVERDSATDEA